MGSINTSVQSRLAANSGIRTPIVSDDGFANANTIPTAPIDTGLLGSTRINTATGPVAIEELKAGQTIITSSGDHARLLHILPAEKPKSALRIRAPYFGANQDFVVGNDHYLEIHSDIAEYMFGEVCVFVPAWVFKDNSKVLFHELEKTDAMFQLQIDGSDGIGIGNCHVSPLLVGSKTQDKRFLTDAEARGFATERRIGQYN